MFELCKQSSDNNSTMIKTAVLLVASCVPMLSQFADRDARYRLQATDVLEIQYRYTPEYNQTVTIQPDGYVTLQLIGDLKLGGLTLEQARDVLTTRAATRLRAPEVVVILKDFEKPEFVVSGEVGNPGRFELRGDVTAVEAIAMAGGFKNLSAKHSEVILFRRFSRDMAETKILNLKRVLNARMMSENVSLAPGDILYVPQNEVSKIERFMKWVNVGTYWSPTR
jgi:polysaccharide biosynthesis/export protein